MKSKLTSLLQEEKLKFFKMIDLLKSIKHVINTCALVNDCNKIMLDFYTSMDAVEHVAFSTFKDNFYERKNI